ncbi:hypothetical protein ACFRCG_30845 [Embleya sp. NPDC056575]|uniref:hypothetical protein n=1 Tax=unclassified Embleya TaxID=2699296 RepID=UPI00367EEFA6
MDALHACAHSVLEDTPVRSPWRWNQAEPSDIVRLADLLTEHGLEVRRVVAANRWHIAGPDGNERFDSAHRLPGVHLELAHPRGTVRISHKPHLGWMIDVVLDTPKQAWNRVDLGCHLMGKSWPFPGSIDHEVSVEDVVEIMSDVDGNGWKTYDFLSGSSISLARQESLFQAHLDDADLAPVDPDPEHALLPAAALGQLRSMGFAGRWEPWDRASQNLTGVHIEWWNRSRDLRLGDVQRLNGIAAAENKKLLVLTRNGMTLPAAAFADKAQTFGFRIDPRHLTLEPLTQWATEAMLPSLQKPEVAAT